MIDLETKKVRRGVDYGFVAVRAGSKWNAGFYSPGVTKVQIVELHGEVLSFECPLKAQIAAANVVCEKVNDHTTGFAAPLVASKCEAEKLFKK